MNHQEFYAGKSFDAYEFLGAHLTSQGVSFTTFAPNAARIFVIGDFNSWTEIHEMYPVYDGNFFSCVVPEAKEGMLYKYRIYQRDGKMVDHCDPYGFGMEVRPKNASVIRDISTYKFQDEAWLKKRNNCMGSALNIYELHLASWKDISLEEKERCKQKLIKESAQKQKLSANKTKQKMTKLQAGDHTAETKKMENQQKTGADYIREDAKEAGFQSYLDIVYPLVDYLKIMGYNYMEIMPLCEHPCDESWGYQNTGYFSPTSRYGSAEELMEFIDICHQYDIGVLLDFVPVHFAIDAYALANYDGTALYEYPSEDVGVSEWGSCNFLHSRPEIRSFLQSSVYYWLKEYHFDGVRMDAVSRLLYWQGDEARGVNAGAVEFLRNLNSGIKERIPQCMLIAEDSTQYPKVTAPVQYGGLGFDYKWDMGWMHDTLNYMKTPPCERTDHYHKLTFSMMYYYKEHYLLPLSHDEVVHGKATILQKMYGEYEEKFPQARALYMYMMAHPGKKLNFMGNEFGQLREWDEKREQDWNVLVYPKHGEFLNFIKDLNKVYEEHSPFWAKDYDERGFQWVDCHQEEKCVYVLERIDEKKKVMAIFNFSDEEQVYELPEAKASPEAKVSQNVKASQEAKASQNVKASQGMKETIKAKEPELTLLLSSEDVKYGGSEKKPQGVVEKVKGKKQIVLPAFCAKYFLVS